MLLQHFFVFVFFKEFSDDNNDGGLGYQFRVFNEDNQPVLNVHVTVSSKQYIVRLC